MRIAFVGKGGSGKSAIAGTFARLLARRGADVLVLDSDPMPGLALSLGMELSDAGLPAETVVENPEEGPRYVLRDGLSPTEAVEAHAQRGPDGVRLLQLGKMYGGPAELIESRFAYNQVIAQLDDNRWHLVGDLPGGTRQPYFGWGRFAATYLVVVEPTAKSWLAARRLAGLADTDDAPRLAAVANKVRDEGDLEAITANIDLPVVAAVPWDEQFVAVEKAGRAIVDEAPDSPVVVAVASLLHDLLDENAVALRA